MDYSFLKLHTSISNALSVGDIKNAQINYWESVWLSPNESYCQLTNFETGIAFNSNYEVYVVDSCDNELKDITGNVYIDQFTDSNGLPQCAIEIINITEDFGGRAVLLRFTNTVSSEKFYTKPIKITDSNLYQTVRLDYKHFEDIDNMWYSNADYYQSIRVRAEYVKPKDNSEVGDYYQISTGRNISSRFLEKTAHEYRCEKMDVFTYDRIKKVFKQSLIYIDGERISDNPQIIEGDRIGRTNLISAEFTLYKIPSETFSYAFQIFDGLEVVSFDPFGSYLTGVTINKFDIEFNIPITLNTGNIYVYNDANVLIDELLLADMSVVGGNTLRVDTSSSGYTIKNPSDDSYYVHVDSGLVSGLGVDYEGISDNTTWTFTVAPGDYDSADYSSDYFTN